MFKVFVTSAAKIEIMIGNNPPLYIMLIPNTERHFSMLLRLENCFFNDHHENIYCGN